MVARPDCESTARPSPARGPRHVQHRVRASAGPQCTVQMVESLTGIYIDHFVVLDFNGFKAMVDAVDGVEVCIPEDVDDDEHNIHFDAGTQELDGEAALDYVRERYVLSVTGDIGRMKRQQAFIASMANKVMSAGTLSRPDRVFSFLDAVTESIQVDDDLDSMRQDGRPGHGPARTRPVRHQVPHRADRGVRARPQPADLDRRREGPVAPDQRTTSRWVRRSARTASARRPGRYGQRLTRRRPSRRPPTRPTRAGRADTEAARSGWRTASAPDPAPLVGAFEDG